jgi:gamma-glutamylcyclotransferase (GGCT)/AIG2-like uncharacterized protein YtfP
MSPDEPLWYFAYGANMSTRVLARRDVEPLSSEAASVAGWRLAFSMPGVPLLEPGFANVEPDPAGVVHGVLHRMRRRDLTRLDRSEGGGYRHRELEPYGVRAGAVRAIAYVYPRAVRPRLPSRRYLELLLSGAHEHALPQPWIEWLSAQPCHHLPLLSDVANRVFRGLEMAHGAILRAGRQR